MEYSTFAQLPISLVKSEPHEPVMVDSRYVDPVEQKMNEFGQRSPTLNTIEYWRDGQIFGMKPQLSGRSNYGSYLHDPINGSDPHHPPHTIQPLSEARFI